MAVAFPRSRAKQNLRPSEVVLCPAQLKAMALWPRLQRRGLVKAGCSPARIASYVSRRTTLPVTSIEKILEAAEEQA